MKYAVLAAAIFILLICSIAVLQPLPQQPTASQVEDQIILMREARMDAAVDAIKARAEANLLNAATVTILHVDKVVVIFGHIDMITGRVIIYSTQVTHNIMVNGGADAIKAAIGTGSTSAWTYIEPTNATMTAAVTDTYCCGGSDKTFVTDTDLAPSSATYTSTGTGTCTIAHTFTETAAVTLIVYGAGLTISTAHGVSANNLRAEANFVASATLNLIGDFVTIVWYITIPAG